MEGTRRGDVDHRGVVVVFLPSAADSDPDRDGPQNGLVSYAFGISPADRQLSVGPVLQVPTLSSRR